MSGHVYAVLGETELEIIAWLSGLDMRFSANYAEQPLIGRKGLLQHTGFTPDELKMRVLLHAQWCNPATEVAKLKRLLDEAEPVAFVLGSGEYRGVFVLNELEVVSTQTDGSGVAIAFEANASLREYVGDPALPAAPGVIAQGYRIPVGAALPFGPASGGPSGPFSGAVAALRDALSAVGQVGQAVSQVHSLVALAQASPLAATSVLASRSDGLRQAAQALPVAAFDALAGVAGVATDAAQVATAFRGAQFALQESADLIGGSDPLAALGAAAGRAQQAVWFCDRAKAGLSRLALRTTVRGTADWDQGQVVA